MKKIIYIILFACLAIIAGIYYIKTNFISADFSSLEGCVSACNKSGYNNGSCLWPKEELTGDVRLGTCQIPSKHCGNAGQCNCSCRNQ